MMIVWRCEWRGVRRLQTLVFTSNLFYTEAELSPWWQCKFNFFFSILENNNGMVHYIQWVSSSNSPPSGLHQFLDLWTLGVPSTPLYQTCAHSSGNTPTLWLDLALIWQHLWFVRAWIWDNKWLFSLAIMSLASDIDLCTHAMKKSNALGD